ncbi:DUF2752 domain-containing protein [Abyssalbus ytuae]|uniref:DUF2752 domain-containing protein n=1 Tax=Abyssalbus ytuae TaxID=2926907 RepID=A0A9E6ZZU8_9FLAO|nr:DUF2752 domain-containing protein [Abyssalbus ytuae]UOB18202.1 DUF2752 domain-containing protein [Abyssalbus ytuae]
MQVITKNKIFFLIITGVALIVMLSLYFNFNPSDYNFFPKCPFYSITGFYCPGCGSQRAIHDLLHGNIIDAIKHNLLIPLVILVIIYKIGLFWLENIKKKEVEDILYNPTLSNIIVVLVISFWILRNINFYPFNILSP